MSRLENAEAMPPEKELELLFWDVEFESLDAGRDADFILPRVLEFGRLRDIDLFSLTFDLELERSRDEVVSTLTDVRVLGLTEATLRLDVAGALVDIVEYPYPLTEPPTFGPLGVLVAGMRDLAAMKLAAVSQRGIRRAFWDL